MKISVITLTYNNANLLPATIRSVFSQNINTMHPIEYLIVDDYSSNFNEVEIDELIKSYNNNQLTVRIIKNPSNFGTVKSFNNAIKEATGDIIVPLSADDSFYDNSSLNKIINAFLDPTVNIATGKCAIISAGNSEQIGVFPHKNVLNLFTRNNRQKLLKHLCINGNIITGAATYYRRSYLLEHGCFNESYVLLEDYPFYIQALEAGEYIKLINDIVVKYREGGISTTKKNPHPKLEKDFDFLAKTIMHKSYLTNNEKRYVHYKRFIKKQDKLKIVTMLKYPLQTLLYAYNIIVKK